MKIHLTASEVLVRDIWQIAKQPDIIFFLSSGIKVT